MFRKGTDAAVLLEWASDRLGRIYVSFTGASYAARYVTTRDA